MRAIGNLVANALRYSPDGGRVILHVTSTETDAIVRVTDNGPGIESTIKERIFERFVTDRKTADQTGLGLAIARSVAELHGGGASVIETQGSGACLELRFRKA